MRRKPRVGFELDGSRRHFRLRLRPGRTLRMRKSKVLFILVRAQFFTFQISTFDKSRFPRALIITWKSHHSPYPLVPLPPYDSHIKTNTDKNRTRLITFQSCPKTTTTTSVTKIYKC